MAFGVSDFFLKMNEWIRFYYYDTSSWLVFVRFLEELKTPERHFEINWPLADLKQFYVEFCVNFLFMEMKKPMFGFKIIHLLYVSTHSD